MNTFLWFNIIITAILAIPIIAGLTLAIWGIRKNRKKAGK